MTRIEVRQIEADPASVRFEVRVIDEGGDTRHEVTSSLVDLARLGGAYGSPEGFIRGCFEFLLERESKGSILRSFDVSVIGRYFPEFERTISPPDETT